MDVLGDYAIQKELGQGPFGQIYLGEHRFIKKRFALKVLPQEVVLEPGFIRRFEEEVSKIVHLDHPNMIKIHNVSCHDGVYFIVMDPVLDLFQETVDLEKFLRLKGRSLSEKEKVELLKQIASALDYAHSMGKVHGSLKLTNILVQLKLDIPHLLLTDFGLSRLMGEKIYFSRITQALTQSLFSHLEESFNQSVELSTRFMTSFSFLAPEQRMLSKEWAQKEVDIYAFGVLAYYLLFFKTPEGYFELPSKAFPDFEYNWDLIVTRCLQTNPMLRPQKLLSLIEEMQVSKEKMSLTEIEQKLENASQMAFEFSQSGEKIQHESSLQPVLKPQEITRPEYEADPGAIFQREMTVSHYTPKKAEISEVKPLLTEMVIIPGGTYIRGGVDGARDEMPRHPVYLESFAMDIHPVTNEQFVRFLEAMGGEKDQNNNDIIRLRDARIKRIAGKLTIESGYAKHPVAGITWYGAIAYAKWIGKRLPTEAEWEAAAAGGRDVLYPTGNDIDRTQANFFSADTTPVMSYPPNPFGLYDMAGNVYDWCQDWYAYNYYDSSILEPHQPQGPQQGVYRVLRGGCWKSLKEDMRNSHRHRNNPGAVNSTYGFRCVADVSPVN